MALGICSKCEQRVSKWNDVRIITAIANNNPVDMFTTGSRHFLPIEGVCEGSPSRAQYISGQPRDTRGYCEYNSHDEKLYREAFAEARRRYFNAPGLMRIEIPQDITGDHYRQLVRKIWNQLRSWDIGFETVENDDIIILNKGSGIQIQLSIQQQEDFKNQFPEVNLVTE